MSYIDIIIKYTDNKKAYAKNKMSHLAIVVQYHGIIIASTIFFYLEYIVTL